MVASTRAVRSLAALAAAWSAAGAAADIVKAEYFASILFHYKLNHMPDFDQRREDCCGVDGLPGDGSMHCVPTATMNLFCYAANHGFPWLDPGPANWASNANYDTATDAIQTLGVLMSTTVANGSNNTGWKNGMQAWLDLYGNGLLTRTHVALSTTLTPSPAGMASKGCNGAIIAFAYGRYQYLGLENGYPKLSRTGGHAVTLVEAWRDPSHDLLRYRDPADDPADTTQSFFVNKEVQVTPLIAVINGLGSTPRNVSAIAYPSDDGLIRLLDAYVTLKPMYMLSFQQIGNTFQLVRFNPLGWDALGGGSTGMGSISGISDMALEMVDESALVLVDVGAAGPVRQLRRVDLPTGTQTTVVDDPSMQGFTLGRDGRIYAHDGGKLYCYRPDGTLEGATSSIPTPSALAYDDEHDHVVVLSIPERKVARLTAGLSPVGVATLPPDVILAGDGSVIVNPLDHEIYLVSGGSSKIIRVTGAAPPFGVQQITVPGLAGPRRLGAGDDGALFVATPEGLRVVRPVGAGWALDPASPFAGLPITGPFVNLRSRSNVDPAIHDTPGWDNIPAGELLPIGIDVPDCVADLDGNGLVDGADIARLLGNWGVQGDAAADLDNNGIVNGADLGILIASWGPCP